MKLAILFMVAMFAFSGADTVVSRITDALENGIITPDEAVKYLTASLNDRSTIPAEFIDGTTDVPCGTAAMDLITSILDDCTAPVRDSYRDGRARPEVGDPEYLISTEHFLIHWTDEGVNKTSESWANTVADACVLSWEVEVDDMEWDAPPSDLGQGGDDKLDIYIINIEGSVIGWCSSSGCPPDPMTPEADYASYIAIDADESWGTNTIEETCAHEFMHALQNGYEAAEPSWFKENTSVWVENYVYDYNGYATYLHGGDNCLRRPWYDIRTTDEGLYEYGASPWPMYMDVRHGGQEAVRMVWENCAATTGSNMWEALEETAVHYGLDLDIWLAEYACWRWFTGNNCVNDDYYLYEEASIWTPGPYVFSYHTVSSLPHSSDEGVYPPEFTGHHWIKVDVENYQQWIEFQFDGRDYFPWVVGVILSAEDGTSSFAYYEVDNDYATIDVGVDADGWDHVIFYVQAVYETTLTMSYEFTIETITGGIEGDLPAPMITLSSVNPLMSGSVINFNLPTGGFTTLNVYDLGGRMIQNIHVGDLSAGEHSFVWNADDLAIGSYFLRLTAPGGGVTQKVILVD